MKTKTGVLERGRWLLALAADTALRLARYFDMSPQFWLGLQMDYDLDVEEDRLSVRLEEVKVYSEVH